MDTFLFLYLESGIFLSFIILFLLLISPLLLRYIKAKSCYYMWLIVIIPLVIPIHLSADHTPYTFDIASLVSHFSPDALSATPSYNILSENTSYNIPDVSTPMPPMTFLASSSSPKAHLLTLSLSASQIVLIIWLLGILISLIYIIYTHIAFQKHTKKWCHALSDPQLQDLATRLKMQYHIPSSTQIAYCKILHTPITVGLRKPIILLPDAAYDPTELELLLAHEMVHCKRKDILYKCLLTTAQLLHWFNPLIYLMKKHIYFLCEVSCDETVLLKANEETRLQYGEMIIDVIKQQSINTPCLSSGFFIEKNKIKERLTHIMNASAKHNGKLITLFLLCIVCTTTLAFGFTRTSSSKIGTSPASIVPLLNGPDSVTQDVLEETLTQYIANTNDIGALFVTIDYLSEETIDEIIFSYIQRTNNISICVSAFPYLSDSTIDQIIAYGKAQGLDTSLFSSYQPINAEEDQPHVYNQPSAPTTPSQPSAASQNLMRILNNPSSVSQDVLESTLSSYIAQTNDIGVLFNLISYIDQETLDQIITDYVNRTNDIGILFNVISDVSTSTVDTIMISYTKRTDDIGLCVSALPYLSQNAINELIKYCESPRLRNISSDVVNALKTAKQQPAAKASNTTKQTTPAPSSSEAYYYIGGSKLAASSLPQSKSSDAFFRILEDPDAVTQDVLDQTTKSYIAETNDIGHIFNIIDRLSTSTVDAIMLDYFKRTHQNYGLVANALPYLSQNGIDQIAKYIKSADPQSSLLTFLKPYVSKGVL